MSMKEEYTAIDMATAAADGFRAGQRAAQSAGVPDIDVMVDRFLSWPLPREVCVDGCATNPDYPGRHGTNLLTADQARSMLEHMLAAAPQVTPMGGYDFVDASLPAAGSAVEEVEVFGWRHSATGSVTADPVRASTWVDECICPLMTVAQHNRIVAELQRELYALLASHAEGGKV